MESNQIEEDLENIDQKGYKISCCRSYLSPKGRCYTCPEDDYDTEDDDNQEEE